MILHYFLLINHAFKNGLEIVNNVFSKFGLTVNTKKTKTMIFNFQQDCPYPTSICQLSNSPIENVQTFRYLGATIQFNQANVGDEEIQHRITAAKSSFQRHKYLLRNFKIHLSTRIQFLNAFVRTQLTYGCSAWSISKQTTSTSQHLL